MKSDKKIAIMATAIMVVSVFAFALVMPVSAALWQWEQVSEEGFDDLTNDYAWAMAEYAPPDDPDSKTYLYVGTLNTNFSGGWGNIGCEVWRTNGTMDSGKYVWEQVVGPSGTQASAGFSSVAPGSSFALGARGMTVYNDTLWAGTMPFAEIFVTNGTAWKLANLPHFNDSNISSTRGITVYNGSLYAEAMDQTNGVRVFRYDGPTDFASIGTPVNRSRWTQVNLNGFDGTTSYNIGVGELIPFDPPDDGLGIEYLYAGTWTVESFDILDPSKHKGFEIWRTNGTEKGDGTLYWEQVVGRDIPYGNPPGFGDSKNANVMSVETFDGALYVGTLNFADGAEIWRTSDGTTWECVVPYGFVHLNGYIWRMIEYKGKLIAGTLNPLFGCELWASATGNLSTWEQINLNGMDLSYNIPLNISRLFGTELPPVPIADQYGVRTVGIYEGDLMVGTASWGDWVDMGLDMMLGGDPPHDYSTYVGCEVWRSNGTECTLPTISVTKTVWNGTAWVHDLTTHVGNVVRFNITIVNTDIVNVTNITIADCLSCSLEYADDATLTLPDGGTQKREPDCNFSFSFFNLSMLKWQLSGLTIEPGQTMYLEYDAYVVKSGIDANFLVSFGHSEEEPKDYVCGWDYVLICSQPAPSGDATDSGGAVKYVYTTGETVYATGEGFTPNSLVDIYIVDDYKWIGGEDINNFHAYAYRMNVPTNATGNIVPTEIWPYPIPGEYDMFFDAVPANGINDLATDVVDNPHDPGFIVQGQVPALTPIGIAALVGLLAIIATSVIVRKRKEQ